VIRRLWALCRKRRLDQELEEELQFHLQQETEELVRTGLALEEARLAARREFGGVEQTKEIYRDVRGIPVIENLIQDLRYGLRGLRRSPGFTAVAVLSLALGIGANTALFSAFDAVMWKSLPVRDPRELRQFTWIRSDKVPVPHYSGNNWIDPRSGQRMSESFSYPAYRAFRDGIHDFADVIGFAGTAFTVTAAGTSEYGESHFVSGNYFTALGVQPAAGRLITPDDDSPGKSPVAVLTYRYWEKRFGLDPRAIGSKIVINQTSATVIGVAPPAFQGLFPGIAVDLFVPMSTVPVLQPSYSLSAPGRWWVGVFARLRPGASDAPTASAAQALLAGLIEDYAGRGPNIEVPRVVLQSGARGTRLYLGVLQQSLYTLGAVVAAVLLIACVNLANLLLARCEARRREIAVRLSIGAARGRLIRQLLTESLVLSGLAAAAGTLLAKPLLQLVLQMLSPRATTLDARVDSRTLLFTLCASILTGLFFGILPAFRATRVDLTPTLKDAGSTASKSGSARKLGSVLVAAQVAFSIVLLAGAGLFVRTLINLMTVDLGIRTDHLLTFFTEASQLGYRGQRLAEVYGKLRAKLESIPGVASVGMSQNGLLRNGFSNTDFYIPGRQIQSHRFKTVYLLLCSDSFLSTMRIPILAGRDLSSNDGPGSPPVVVVNETFVREYLDGQNPIGMTVVLGRADNPSPSDARLQIVGVAKDAHYSSVRADPPPTAYLAYRQPGYGGLRQMSFAIRTNLPPLAIATAVRKAVAEIDPNLPVVEMRTMDDQVSQSIQTERLITSFVSGFGIAAALLTAIGLFGVMAYAVARRSREIGIRLAVGATPGRIRSMVLRESVVIVLAGYAVGMPAALGLSRLVESMLYHVRPHDAWSFLAAALLMLVIGAAAAWLPARRASRVDPMTALRCE
jgi:predicted permease